MNKNLKLKEYKVESKKAFTLVEILVVIILMVVLMSVTAPMGSKIFNQFKSYVAKTQESHQLNQERTFAFIEAEAKNIIINDINYSISTNGIISQ